VRPEVADQETREGKTKRPRDKETKKRQDYGTKRQPSPAEREETGDGNLRDSREKVQEEKNCEASGGRSQ
jgi:hypothetical protein